ncbi:MAG: phosphodiester glycosidase family protein [Clostridia bacterium]|nr:phosphodiester glycosidase family protein [Clostridia bacterium]
MKANVLRWCAAALMLALLATFFSTPGLSEVDPLPLEMLVRGRPLKQSGWKSDVEYEDESIHMVMDSAIRKPKSSKGKVTCRWVRVSIADPSQLRTVMSNDSYEDPTQARPAAMAKDLNAVVACNDDFMKYKYDLGYVVRQGVFYRNAVDGSRDILLIDDRGDFSFVKNATADGMAAKTEEIANEGRNVVNSFSFGPVLVADGEVQDFSQVPKSMEKQLATQRIAICQLGELEYGIVEIDGGNGNGMNLTELATYITLVFPECKVAYNLDGGGSTNLMINGKRVHKTPNSRSISGLIYFASAAMGD